MPGRNSAKDGINQIFIYPVLEDYLQGLDTLMHTWVHVIDDCMHHHAPEFRKVAIDVGPEDKLAEASAGPRLKE